jgi:transposase-like protein
MSVPTSPELRQEILNTVKGGMTVVEASAKFNIAQSTIRKWMREISANPRSSTNELQRARRRIQFLEQVILELVLEQKAQTYKGEGS